MGVPEVEAISSLPVKHAEAMYSLFAKSTTGAFLPNDYSRHGVTSMWTWKINGSTWVDALDRWLRGERVFLKDPQRNVSVGSAGICVLIDRPRMPMCASYFY